MRLTAGNKERGKEAPNDLSDTSDPYSEHYSTASEETDEGFLDGCKTNNAAIKTNRNTDEPSHHDHQASNHVGQETNHGGNATTTSNHGGNTTITTINHGGKVCDREEAERALQQPDRCSDDSERADTEECGKDHFDAGTAEAIVAESSEGNSEIDRGQANGARTIIEQSSRATAQTLKSKEKSEKAKERDEEEKAMRDEPDSNSTNKTNMTKEITSCEAVSSRQRTHPIQEAVDKTNPSSPEENGTAPTIAIVRARNQRARVLSDEGGKRQRAETLLAHIRSTAVCAECTKRGTVKPKSLVLDQAQNKRRFKCTGCNKSYGCSSFLNAFEHLSSASGLPTVYASPVTPNTPCATRVNPQTPVAPVPHRVHRPMTPSMSPIGRADGSTCATPASSTAEQMVAPTPIADPRFSRNMRIVNNQIGNVEQSPSANLSGHAESTMSTQIAQTSLFQVPQLQTSRLGPQGVAAALIPPTKAEMIALRGGREAVLEDTFNDRHIEQGRRKRIRKALKVLCGPSVPQPAEMVRVGVEMAQRNIGMMLSALQQVGFDTNRILHAMATSSGAELVIPSSYAPSFVDRAHAFGITLTQPMAAKPATPDGRRTLLKRLEEAAIKAGHANTRAFFALWAAQVRQVAPEQPTINLGNTVHIERTHPPTEHGTMATSLSTVNLGCIDIEDDMDDADGQLTDTSEINADEQCIGVDRVLEPTELDANRVKVPSTSEHNHIDEQWLHITYLNVCGLSTEKLDIMSSRLQPNSICFLAETWHIDEARRIGHPNMLATSLEVHRSLVSRGKGGLHAIAHTALKPHIRTIARTEYHITVAYGDLVIAAIYLPPSLTNEQVGETLASLDARTSIVIGDFNAKLSGLLLPR